MEAFRRLPDEIVPYAERMFAWFPEVLVTLGNAKLGELYELPPKASVQMRLEETADCKLVQIRLHRRPRRPPPQPSPSSGTPDESPFTKSRAFAADVGYEEEECQSPFSKARALAAAERTLVAEPASTPGSGGNRRSSGNSGSPGGPTRPTTGEQDAAHEPVQAEAAQADALDQAPCNVESTHVSAGATGSAAPALDSPLGSTAPAHGAGAGARQEKEEEEQEGGRQEAGGDGDQRADPRLEGGPESDKASEPTVPSSSQESSAQHAEAAAPEAASSEGKRTASPRTTP